MAYQPFYDITDWQNLPSQKTAINRTNLLHVENGIKEADNRIAQLDAKKAEISLVNTLVKSVVVDAKTGVITVTQQNGTVTTYDLDIEKVIANFDITDDNILILTLADGTTKEVDLTKFVITFASTSTISMSMKNRVVTAEIIDGSVTMDKLDAAIQNEFRQYMLDAQTARDAALQYQKFSKRYALGDAEFEGSATDNAKYYYEQSKINADTSLSNSQAAATSAETATTQAGISNQKAVSAAVSANSAAADKQIATQKAEMATKALETATEKAEMAADSEAIATRKASEASASATAAAGSAASASEKAATATQKAGEASASAKAAAESAKRAEEVSAIQIATNNNVGVVKPDGTTITVDVDGTIHGAPTISNAGDLSAIDSHKLGSTNVQGQLDALAVGLQNVDVELPGKDISDTVITTLDTVTASFPEPAAGERGKTFFGKVKKFIADFNTMRSTLLTLSKIVNNGLTTQEGYVADARQLNPDLEGTIANQLRTVNSNFADIDSKISKLWNTVFLETLVPLLTGYAGNNGTVIYSGEYDASSQQAWKVFDGNTATFWGGAQNKLTGEWVGYNFSAPVCVNKITFRGRQGTTGQNPKVVNIDCYVNDKWQTIYTTPTLPATEDLQGFTFDNTIKANKWRFCIVETYSTGYETTISELQFWAVK